MNTIVFLWRVARANLTHRAMAGFAAIFAVAMSSLLYVVKSGGSHSKAFLPGFALVLLAAGSCLGFLLFMRYTQDMRELAELKETLVPDYLRPTLSRAWLRLLAKIDQETQDIKRAGGKCIPEISYESIVEDGLSPVDQDFIRKRGVVIIRGVVPTDQAVKWREELEEYVKLNASEQGPNPEVFHSRPQYAARQHSNMAKALAFLNRLWTFRDSSRYHFDPDRQAIYLEGITMRKPGSMSSEGFHMEGGALARWSDIAYQRHYRNLFAGQWELLKPYDARFRVLTRDDRSSVFCSHHGYLALSPQGSGDGTLRVIPLLREALAFAIMRPFLDDVPPHEFCGVAPSHTLRIDETWHQKLLDAAVTLPELEPGDFVAWHPDLIHAFEPLHEGKDISIGIKIAAAPLCSKNALYSVKQRECVISGEAPPDFCPALDLATEGDAVGRAHARNLSQLGQAQLGLRTWPTDLISSPTWSNRFSGVATLVDLCNSILEGDRGAATLF